VFLVHGRCFAEQLLPNRLLKPMTLLTKRFLPDTQPSKHTPNSILQRQATIIPKDAHHTNSSQSTALNMLFKQCAHALLGLTSVAQAHMIMTSPVPFGKSTLTNSPLAANGADFPCKQRSGVYDAEGASNTMAPGSTQKLAFQGIAVHGGGSCQVSLTTDTNPSQSSTWKVIHSIEGGCPAEDQTGNMDNPDPSSGDGSTAADPYTYSFKIPDGIAAGTYTLAWTWFNKVGNREMYMNCAPVTIGGSSKRDEDLVARNETQLIERASVLDSLPDMFTANIGNGCGTVDSTDLLFPQPGDSVEQLGQKTSSALSKPTGNCQAAVAGASPTAGDSGSANTVAPVASQAPPASSSTVPGGVFATVGSGSGSAAPLVATSAPASQATSAVPVVVSSAVASSAAAPAATGTSSSAGAMAAGSSCAPEGQWNCLPGGTTYQRCGSGIWTPVMQLAAGTTCTSGQSANINIVAGRKASRAIRFSEAHVRRHLAEKY